MKNNEKIKRKKQFYFEDEPRPRRREKEHRIKHRNSKVWMEEEYDDDYLLEES